MRGVRHWLGCGRRTPRTLTEPGALKEQLAAVRACGYAVEDEEYEVGVRSIAAPIWDDSGNSVAGRNTWAPIVSAWPRDTGGS
jgi:DNA-binding IclR family transcriptional regulator